MTDKDPVSGQTHDNEEEEFKAAMTAACRKHTDPIFIGDYFASTGHDESTPNGTATFIKHKGRIYVCTCKHVAEAKVETNAPTPMLKVGRCNINLSRFSPNGLELCLRAPSSEGGDQPDICIADASSFWKLLKQEKNKEAIDLDSWIEPDWEEISYCGASGYTNEHKTREGDILKTPMPLIIAKLQSIVTDETREFTLHSDLAQPHEYYFSGVSGGPIFAPTSDDGWTLIGIIIEGGPSSAQSPPSFTAGPNDIFIRGLRITPGIFQEWLDRLEPPKLI